MSLEVLGGFSALARRKLIFYGVGCRESQALALHQKDVLYKSWGQESLQSFYLNRKIKM